MLKMSNVGVVPVFHGLRVLGAYSLTGIRGIRRVTATVSPGLFFREWLASPGGVGAIWPSSKQLARCMVAPVPTHGDGLVVELGAGTGAVTAALLGKGIQQDRLRVIERLDSFAHHLRKRFPTTTVLQADACELTDVLPFEAPVDAIVSSLPLRAMDPADVAAIVGQWAHLVRPGGVVVQFTYALGTRAPDLGNKFVQCSNRYVWNNLPPAQVMTFVRLAH